MAKKTWIPFPSKCFRNIYMTRSYQHWSIRHSMKLLRKKAEQQSVSVALDLDSEEYKSKLKQILITHGLTCISPPSTVYRWTTGLGFRYAPRNKKGYYVDGYEKPATIQNRWDFCKWSYLGYEERMHRWTQQRAAEEAVSWKRRWDNKGLKLQERESSILGVAPRIFTIGFLWRGKRVKRTSGLWCERACQKTKS